MRQLGGHDAGGERWRGIVAGAVDTGADAPPVVAPDHAVDLRRGQPAVEGLGAGDDPVLGGGEGMDVRQVRHTSR
jgi:hypothetical protein